jgi:hypothetical protein
VSAQRFALRVSSAWASYPPAFLDGREVAEHCLRAFAEGAGLDVHLHPASAAYSDSSCSTAYTKGGDPFLDAVAVLRLAGGGL